MAAFLLALESGYGSNPYHNPIHAADVITSLHLFLTQFGLTRRMAKNDILAALIGAMVHDFHHPGSSNAHEIKVCSRLAVTYSDRSPLESSHLASAFALLNCDGLNVLGGVGTVNYRSLRALIIEMVLRTDLARHFEFISRLQALAAEHGSAASEAAQQSKRRMSDAATARRMSDAATVRRASVASAMSGSESRRGSLLRRASVQLVSRSSVASVDEPCEQARRGSFKVGMGSRRTSRRHSESRMAPQTLLTDLDTRSVRLPSLTSPTTISTPSESYAPAAVPLPAVREVATVPKWRSPLLQADVVDMEMLLVTAVRGACSTRTV